MQLSANRSSKSLLEWGVESYFLFQSNFLRPIFSRQLRRLIEACIFSQYKAVTHMCIQRRLSMPECSIHVAFPLYLPVDDNRRHPAIATKCSYT